MNDFPFSIARRRPAAAGRGAWAQRLPAGALVAGALVAGALWALAGCTTLPPGYQPPAAQIPAQFSSASPADASQVGELAWRDYFTEPELQALITKALANNRDLRAAMLRVEQARAAYGISRADRVPAVGLGLDSQRTRVPGDLNFTGRPIVSSQHQLGVGLTSWEIDLWGRVRNMNEAALQTYLASADGQRATTLMLVAQVADGWLSVRELDHRIQLADQALATRTEARRRFARRVEVGSSSKLDFVQVELLWQQASALVTQLQLQRSTQLHALGLLVGEPGLSLAPATQPLSALAPLPPVAP
ncbi:MAG TPA: TolC family protein, partial [Alicycliphilus sp.]|nr:TolC family protein [Alicycliphilus sp.]